MGRRSKKKAAYRRAAQQVASRPARRSNTWKLGMAGVWMLLAGGLIALLVLSSSSEELSKETGKVAPGFELRTIGGERFTLAEQRGNVVVLEFLEAGCPSCTVDVAGLSEIAAGGEVGAAVLIADIGGLGPRSLRDYYHGQLGASPELKIAPDSGFRVAQAYGVTELGETVVIDPEGRVSWRGIWNGAPENIRERIEEAAT